jgi:hypothetical protein
MKQTQKKLLDKRINQAYDYYLKKRDNSKLMEVIYNELSKELVYLNADDDFIYNFILDFIETRLQKVLESYQKYNKQVPFSVYLRGSIKFAYYSYYKSRKKMIKFENQIVYYDNALNIIDDSYTKIDKNENHWILILSYLQQFKIKDRIIFKLYYNFPLNANELQYLVLKKGFQKIKEYYKKQENYEVKDKYNVLQLSDFNNDSIKEPDSLNANLKKRRTLKKNVYAADIGRIFDTRSGYIYGRLTLIRKKLNSMISNHNAFNKYQCA